MDDKDVWDFLEALNNTARRQLEPLRPARTYTPEQTERELADAVQSTGEGQVKLCYVDDQLDSDISQVARGAETGLLNYEETFSAFGWSHVFDVTAAGHDCFFEVTRLIFKCANKPWIADAAAARRAVLNEVKTLLGQVQSAGSDHPTAVAASQKLSRWELELQRQGGQNDDGTGSFVSQDLFGLVARLVQGNIYVIQHLHSGYMGGAKMYSPPGGQWGGGTRGAFFVLLGSSHYRLLVPAGDVVFGIDEATVDIMPAAGDMWGLRVVPPRLVQRRPELLRDWKLVSTLTGASSRPGGLEAAKAMLTSNTTEWALHVSLEDVEGFETSNYGSSIHRGVSGSTTATSISLSGNSGNSPTTTGSHSWSNTPSPSPPPILPSPTRPRAFDVPPTETALKFVVVGDSGVGKTSLIERLCCGTFNRHSPTIGMDMKFQAVKLDGKIYNISIWDTAGQERYQAITTSYYRGANVVIFVCDVTKHDSFQHLQERWLPDVFAQFGASQPLKMIVANKVDQVQDRVVTAEDGLELAKEWGCLYKEASAKSGMGADMAFLYGLVTTVALTPQKYAVASAMHDIPVRVSGSMHSRATPRGCC